MGKRNHYCDQCKKGSHGESHFMSGALIGALIGTALGVLFAPDTGEKTRRKIKTVGDDLSLKGKVALDKVEVIAEEVKVAAAPLLEEIERNMGPVLKKAKASGKDVHNQVLERIEQLVDEVEDVADDVGKNAKKMFKGIKK